MLDNFEIKSVNGIERVTLEPASRQFMAVSVTGANLSASAQVAFLAGGDGLHQYWAEIASEWRGWTGEKSWRSLEGDLGFWATSDKAGHVTLLVMLNCGTPSRWQVRVVLALEAGQLDSLASHALALSRSLGATI